MIVNVDFANVPILCNFNYLVSMIPDGAFL